MLMTEQRAAPWKLPGHRPSGVRSQEV